MTTLNTLSTVLLVLWALSSTALGISFVFRTKRKMRWVKLFGCLTLFFFLASLLPRLIALREENRVQYALAVKAAQNPEESAQSVHGYFAKAGGYEDAKAAAALLKTIMDPATDFSGLIRTVRNYPGRKETLSDTTLARFLLEKTMQEKNPEHTLAFLSAWPMSIPTASAIVPDNSGWKLSVRDPERGWLRKVADPASDKAVVYFTQDLGDNDPQDTVCFSFMDLLPAPSVPGPDDTVGKVILLTQRSTKIGMYSNGKTAAGVLSIEVALCSLPEMRGCRQIGKVSGGQPPHTTSQLGGIVHGIKPSTKEVRELVAKAARDLLKGR